MQGFESGSAGLRVGERVVANSAETSARPDHFHLPSLPGDLFGAGDGVVVTVLQQERPHLRPVKFGGKQPDQLMCRSALLHGVSARSTF
jgi:hypothetical protein